MRALFDTDVLLDLLLDRKPFADAAAALWQAHQEGKFEGYISAITPVNVFYIARKLKGADMARRAVKELLGGLRVCVIDGPTLQLGLTLSLSDYEDAVQHATATANRLDTIVTRNIEDYKSATIPVFTPTEFLIELKKQVSDDTNKG